MGLAQLPEPIVAGPLQAGQLVQVLEPFAPIMPGLFLCYPSRHQMMPKLRAFIDHVKSRSGAADKVRTQTDVRPIRSRKGT
jgi:DNA-binding transcriptional LysR family regulator